MQNSISQLRPTWRDLPRLRDYKRATLDALLAMRPRIDTVIATLPENVGPLESDVTHAHRSECDYWIGERKAGR